LIYFIYPRWSLNRHAKIVENEEFNRLIATSQLIDIREANEFRIKHIHGARNLPTSQIKQSINAISKNKPVLLYEFGRPSQSRRIAKMLKKEGIPEIYILKDGLSKWNGKIK